MAGDEVRKLLSHGVIYAAGALLSRVVSLVMMPLYTRALSPAEYGVVDLLDVTASVIVNLTSVAITATVMRFYYDEEDARARGRVVSTALVGLVGFGVVAVLAFWPLAPALSRAMFTTDSHSLALRLMAVTAVLYGLVEVPMTYLRALERPGLFLLVSLGRLALGVVLNVALVVVLHWGVMGVVWANALSSLATALALAAFTVPRTGLRVSPRVLKGMLWFGVPFVPSSLAMLVVHNGDRYILAAFRPLHEIGIYSLGYKLGMILTYAIAVPFTNVWTTRMYTVVREPGGRAAYARVCRYFVYTLLFAWVGLAVCAPELVALAASREFVAAAWFVPVIAGAYVLREVAECWKNAFLIEKRTRTLAWLQPLMAAVNLVLTYVLVRGVGTHGAAWATLWTFVLMVVLTVWLAEDLMPTPVDWGRLAIAAGAAVVIFLLGLAVPPLPLPVSLPVKVALALLFPLALVGFHAVPPDERRIAAELLARARARGNGMRR